MKDGKFAEHWNLGQAVPEKSKIKKQQYYVLITLSVQNLYILSNRLRVTG
ncbi:MAG: hypothetical protein ACI9YH_000594 [Colwellia sp.]|jgi:hypothetical protein